MNVLRAIDTRRSIRRFTDKPVQRETIEKLLSATIQAPSAKNRQPWRFVVVEEAAKDQLVNVMREKIASLHSAGHATGSCEGSTRAMDEASAVILVFNGEAVRDTPDADWKVVDLQSIGGAIQTMLLAAQEYGLGTLWICDVYYAYDELLEWLGREDQLVAAVAVGHSAQNPDPRPRTDWREITVWRQ